MLALLAVGALAKTKAFPFDDLSADMVSKISIKKPIIKDSYSVDDNYLELISPLMKRGRHDLVDAIEQLLERYNYRESASKVRIKRFYRKHLKDNLIRCKRFVHT